jgi:DNA mismatch repair protein MutS2
MEPQAVVEDTNALALTERLLELEQDRILRQLSWAVGEAAAPLAANLDWIGHVDLAHAQAALAEGYGGTVPRVEDEGALALRGVAHPLLLLAAHARQGWHSGRPPADEPGHEAATEAAAGSTSARGPEAGSGAAPEPVVRNDVALGGEVRCLVISGANTGGKTVLLKAVGLCALLVRHGMPIPALAGSRCDRFAEVWADIGDQQSLETSLSTFSAQIRLMSQWLPHAGAGSLVLLDEMLTGTEPAQGAALAAGALETLLAQGALTLVTTHFGELKELAADHPGIVNASMTFDLRHLRPTYRLQVGLPGASYAVQIARRHGLPESIVQRAEATLAERPTALDALLVQVGERQRELEHAAEQQRRREARHRRAEEELARARAELQQRERELRRREQGAIGAELRAARRRIGEVIHALQQAHSLPTVSKVRERLAALEREFERAPADEGPDAGAPGAPAGPLEPGALQPGATVWLPSLQRRAVLEALLDEGRRARVRLGALTMELAREELAAPPAGAPAPGSAAKGRARRGPAGADTPPAERGGAPLAAERGGAPLAAERGRAIPASGAAEGQPHAAPPDIPFALSTEENTLDVRGLRLEEALEQTEQFFDRCTMKHVSPVMVIHGHGTGRLKLGLRERLQESPYVAAFRPGGAHEGRDGVTIVALAL